MKFKLALCSIDYTYCEDYRSFPFLSDEELNTPLFEIEVSKDILATLKSIKEKNIASLIIFDKASYSLSIINKKVCSKTFGTGELSYTLIWDKEKDENAFVFGVHTDYSFQVEWSLKINAEDKFN